MKKTELRNRLMAGEKLEKGLPNREKGDMNMSKNTPKPLEFHWSMTGKEWEGLMADDAAVKRGEHICENPDTYGTCYIGILCAEIQHSLDTTDPYAYTNVYMNKEGANYGTTPSGFNYDLLDDGPEVPMQCKSFEMFKRAFEENFTSYIARKHLEEAAAQPLADWN